MVDDIDFNKSVKSIKIKWKDSDFIGHYALPIPLIGAVIVLILDAKYYQSHNYQIGMAVTIGLLYLIIDVIYQNDKLIKVPFYGNVTELRKSLKEKIEQDGWILYRNNAHYITADKQGKWLAGSKMAILFDKGVVFINVQNLEGFRGYFPFSFGRNKRIREEFIKSIGSYKVS
ncbi:hypothetical protein HQ865_04175 [Mucilaginibacter mali]|uniref:Uncharacterized protein n=1 Tax=Mucilaginibacter mali TaxID=2740462 RepID=A0A7D4UJE1_9SPHI|nr:hypothetical protein [Mucilaginibacter mali]QKJ28982.1 hypothetical protein HQ865_04175 [Mucilaginibacter mali]